MALLLILLDDCPVWPCIYWAITWVVTLVVAAVVGFMRGRVRK